MKEELILCPLCGSDACYKTPISEKYSSYFCFGGGHQSNDLMTESEFKFEEYEETIPQLYIDLKQTDSEGRVWYPATVNLPEKGTVFINGSSKDKWQWCAIKTRELTEEESKSLANKGIKYKSDTSTMKFFEGEFIEALDYVGFFDKE
jgi:hypothetical protein